MGDRSETNVYHNGVREEDPTLTLPSPSVREREFFSIPSRFLCPSPPEGERAG
jgi:hypothetical protein